MKKFLLSTLLMLLSVAFLHAQVTTSSINGSIKDSKGEALIGATVKATHQPSGTVYGAATNAEGRFNIPNARIGGPYIVEVSYLGFKTKTITGIDLKLGQPYVLNSSLSESGTELQEVVVSADRTSVFNSTKTGAATNVSSRQIATLPTISRSITDFTRTTPQASGNSFAGRDARYNNIQVDGANLNNNFGLSNDPLPGGGAQPISLDAYEEISVNIAPYDVRQSGFTGAGINAVTKSGTNTFHGSAYGFYRDQSFLGTKVGDNDISKQITDSKSQTFGGTIGGPIIKNKVFFFLNGELEKGSKPGITYSPAGGSGIGNISTTSIDSLKKFSDILKTKYGYDPGAYDNFPNFENKNRKILGKIDWNINPIHKLTLKYSDFENTNDVALNGSSVPNGGGFTPAGGRSSLSRLPYNRFSNNSMAFANSNYGFKDVVRTGTFELNSNFGGRMANQFLATVSKIQTVRTFPGSVFPTIDIFDGKGNNYMSAGMDPYTYNNEVINDIYSITDNFTYYLGKHTLTAGGTYEYQNVGNMFMAGSNGYYAYSSLDDFAKDRAPAYFAYTYSLVPGVKNPYSAELKVGQLGLYAQDEYQINPSLNVTFGVRADKAIYHEDPIANPSIDALELYNEEGKLTKYSSGSWPKSRILLSPRVGFRWDALNNNSLVVRGGTGLFTGRIPFVFLTNMPTNSGMYQFGGAIKDAATLSGIRFSSNPDAHADLFPKTAGTSVPSNIVLMDPDFKFPQVIRTNLAVDKELGNGFTLTLEGLHTQDVNGVKMRNANLTTPTGTINEGNLTRPRFVDTNGDNKVDSKDRSKYSATNTAIVLENTDKGYSTALTAMLSKSFSNGFYGSVAYNFTHAKEVTANPGSQASSVWNSNPNVGTSNAVEMGYSQYGTPHRVVANLSYKKEYAKHFASTLSVFYEGSYQSRYSFVVNGDLNGDGNSSTDLMYIPNNASEMNFAAYEIKDKAGNIVNSYTPEQQAAAFEQFINNSSYLKNNRGQYAERNAALTPWYNKLDVRFLQDFYIETGEKNTKHTLQFTADILNAANLINKNWGIQQRYITNNPLQYRSINGDGEPVYILQNINGELVTEHIQDNISTSSTWSMQLGLRYSF
ncbi:TonB-dependent receptor [Pontibacter vulgaris]|uniref:TonB-dependent receptor n=1 Tax=Pontibacter vulgaris TaxID=2905679 RepID=UPI001FA6EAC5|nr:carboxypeptidase regulatory-like domain-containing protein [Pontibacter vulgaris]